MDDLNMIKNIYVITSVSFFISTQLVFITSFLCLTLHLMCFTVTYIFYFSKLKLSFFNDAHVMMSFVSNNDTIIRTSIMCVHERRYIIPYLHDEIHGKRRPQKSFCSIWKQRDKIKSCLPENYLICCMTGICTLSYHRYHTYLYDLCNLPNHCCTFAFLYFIKGFYEAILRSENPTNQINTHIA